MSNIRGAKKIKNDKKLHKQLKVIFDNVNLSDDDVNEL